MSFCCSVGDLRDLTEAPEDDRASGKREQRKLVNLDSPSTLKLNGSF